MATIKAIEARSVHQIQSGQVIVDLCSVVKEAVENSLDAGATSIEVRFKNQGLDSIEVQDNGSGISKQNYETLALKHYTSKLATYEDLTTLQTFGFRGEALSSLCALSKFSVITCLAEDAPKGSKLEFETSGKLSSTSMVAAQKGTTITVNGLFSNLPVRRRELERNIKREWNRVISVLNQYACIQTGVKFSVSQQPSKGKKITLFSTKGNDTTRENIINVFGAKTLTVLIPLDLELELEQTTVPGQKWSAQKGGDTHKIRVRGHVSRPAHGEGRQTPDRQMFFVNGRPCGLPQFAKVFNEVYRSYNASQSPFIFADIQLDTHLYDVNVSPDKRTILLHDQSRMLDNLRESLAALFEKQDYSVPMAQLGMVKPTPFKRPSLSRRDTPNSDESSPSLLSRYARTKDSQAGEQSDEEVDEDQSDEDGEDEARDKSSKQSKSRLQERSSVNLISRYVQSKPEPRSESPSATGRASSEYSAGAPRTRSRASSRFPRSTEIHSDDADSADEPDHESPGDTIIPDKVSDFNAHLAQLNDLEDAREKEIPDSSQESRGIRAESPIPAVTPSSRNTRPQGGVTAPSPFRSQKRNSPEIATITVGDSTITTVIGTPSKKRRIDDPGSFRHPSPKKPSKESVPVPSFQGRLSQMFGASSGTTVTTRSRLETTTEMVEMSPQAEPSEEESLAEEASDEAEVNSSESNDDDPVGDDARSPHVDEESQDEKELSVEKDDEDDDDMVDEVEKRALEESKVQTMIESAEDAAKADSAETERRTQSFVKGSSTKKKDSTAQVVLNFRINEDRVRESAELVASYTKQLAPNGSGHGTSADDLDADDAEEKLSLTISKSDFGKMKVIGQFNLGFILAVRAAEVHTDSNANQHAKDDELFIIDQHATDEKYNFERLQASTVVQSQRLVQPKTLDLTALEEEVIMENLEALAANGFMVNIDESGDEPVGSRCQLLSLPLSRETTFSLADLEELISLLTDHQSTSAAVIPRPSKVRKMFAMRACRSSVMIGKSLTNRHMEKLVRHMGELDKPWNCPHGRPTMRHLSGLGAWNELSWREGDGFDGERAQPTNWSQYLQKGSS